MKSIKNYSFLMIAVSILMVKQGYGQNASNEYWKLAENKENHVSYQHPNASLGKIFIADIKKVSRILTPNNIEHSHFSKKEILINIPLPSGEVSLFVLTPTSVMATELSKKYPHFRTYSGHEVVNPINSGRFDITSLGFHGLFKYDNNTVVIDPVSAFNKKTYVSYFKDDAVQLRDTSYIKHPPKVIEGNIEREKKIASMANGVKDNEPVITQKYRLAVSATGEFTAYHGGTVENGMAAIVTLINRINEIFQRDLSVILELVADNDLLVFTNASTDPFRNNDDDGGINTHVTNEAIGFDNYDIGHVLNTSSGGLAVLGALCRSHFKGDGVTGSRNPSGDIFILDYLAHEIGHQFGASHTFNGESGSCKNNNSKIAAYEIGSGTTLMAYAGICSRQNIQAHSDEYFHGYSIVQMHNTMDLRDCGITVDNPNFSPEVNAGQNFIIPASTPFQLSGSATDIDEDQLTYDWQQFDLGPYFSTRTDDNIDYGEEPLFRVFNPNDNANRYIPQISDVLNNTSTYGETMATTTRELNFRLVVRDNRGGVNWDNVKLNVIDTGGSFSVLSPQGNEMWDSHIQEISWRVSQTDVSPISCNNVDIDLSENNGETFDISIAKNVPNNGHYLASIPVLSTESARLKISCANNIFFAINDAAFSISTDYIIIVSQESLITNEDQPIELKPENFVITGANIETLNILPGENYTVEEQMVIPNNNFFGPLAIGVQANVGEIVSNTFLAVVSVISVPDAPVAFNDSAIVPVGETSITIDVLANDIDVDSEELVIESIQYSGDATVEIVENQIMYSPFSDFVGEDSLTYTVIDESAQSDNGNVTIDVKREDPVVINEDKAGSSSGGSSGGTLDYFMLTLLMLIVRFTEFKRPSKINYSGSNL